MRAGPQGRDRFWQVALLLAVTGCASTAPAARVPGGLVVPEGAQQAVVVRHTDGDTIVLRGIGTGPLPGGADTKVRVLEVDTPE
ncbi:MAG: hypothetical protein ABIO67_10845, partial [Mycobacteriales bacterium]